MFVFIWNWTINSKNEKIWLHSILGTSKCNLEDYQGASNDLNIAINLDPHDTNILYNRGVSKFNLKDYEGAIKEFDEVLLKEPSNQDALEFRDYIKSGLESVRKNSEILNYGPLTLLPEKCEAIWFESSINLDHREFAVLHCLLRFQGEIISPSWIINESFPFDKKDDTREIEIYIAKLRKKLEPDPVKPIYLRSVFNYEDFIEGYILELPTGSQNNLRKEFIDNFL